MLKRLMRRMVPSRLFQFREGETDRGFTLNEVVWALFLLGIVATAALGLFLNGMTTVTDFQRQQAAASLASTALDQARSVTGAAVNSHGTSGLVKGRTQSNVESVWWELTAVDPNLTADMALQTLGPDKEAWDVAPGMTTADEWVPIRTTRTVDKQDYTIDTLVGLCFRLKTAPNLGQSCTPTRGAVDDAVMYRVRVVVRWDTGSGEEKMYTVSTLVDPSEDPVWNTVLMPYPYDDEFSVVAGSPETYHHLLANDTFDELHATWTPIVNIAPPSHGTVTTGSGDTLQGVYFRPPADLSGTVTFTYKLRDAAGQISDNEATVMVHILPDPVSDDFTVEPGTLTDITDLLLDNDTGVPNISSERETQIKVFLDDAIDYFSTEEVTQETLDARAADQAALAAKGITTDPDGNVWFEAPTTDGEVVTFSYFLIDGPAGDEGPLYPNTANPASVTITTASVPLHVVDGDFNLNASSSQTWHTLDWHTLTGNSSDVRIKILDVTNGGGGHMRLDGNALGDEPGDTLEFRTRSDNVGVYDIEYVVVSPGGNESEAGTLTVTVAPTVTDRSYTLDRGDARNIDLASLGIPSTGTQIQSVTGLPANCGSLTIMSETHVRYTASTPWSTSNRTCTFQYRLVTVDEPHVVSSSTGTITITIRRFT